jgi:hypothetical protein
MSQSAHYVSHDIPGYADLDDHGVWREDLQYAWIWVPRVTPGWAPYRFGHWAWLEPWGWTWVDDAPWGYAPFHYGRWIFVGSAWGWVPGPVVARPLFCPALVAWVGGSGFSLGISIGGPPVGWFPLGPREVWMPPYHHSSHYIERVNVTNTVIVNRTIINNYDIRNVNYMNRRVPGGITAVSRDVLVSGRPVGSSTARVPADTLNRAQILEFADVAPQRGSVFGRRMPGGVAPPSAVMNRGIVARATPPPAPVPFAQRQAALQSSPGRPLDQSAINQIRQRQPQPSRPAIRQAGPIGQQPGRGPEQPVVAPQPGEQFPRRQPDPRRIPSPSGQPPSPQTEGRGQRFPVPQPRPSAPAQEQPQIRRAPQPSPAQRPPGQQPTQTPPPRRPEFRRPAESAPQQPQVQQPTPAPPQQTPPRTTPPARGGRRPVREDGQAGNPAPGQPGR